MGIRIYEAVCSVTGVTYFSSVRPTACGSMIHPYLNVPTSEALKGLLRLESYENLINSETSADAFINLAIQRLHTLRVFGLVVAHTKGMLDSNFRCGAIPHESQTDKAKQYLLNVYGKDVLTFYGMRSALTAVASEAIALRILSDAYSGGFPKIADVSNGCWGNLLTACLDEAEEYTEEVRAAHFLQANAEYIRIRSAIDYQILCTKSIGYVKFKPAAYALLKDCNIRTDALDDCAEHLYWLYFKDISDRAYRKTAYSSTSSHADEDADEDEVDRQMEAELSSASEAILAEMLRSVPDVLLGKSQRMRAMLPLQQNAWDVKKVLAKVVSLFSKTDNYYSTPESVALTLPATHDKQATSDTKASQAAPTPTLQRLPIRLTRN